METHCAPHSDSLSDRHAYLAWCDASDLTMLIEERGPDLWVHGHIHSRADYTVGRTRIVYNARGHSDEVTGFQSAFVVDLEHRSPTDDDIDRSLGRR